MFTQFTTTNELKHIFCCFNFETVTNTVVVTVLLFTEALSVSTHVLFFKQTSLDWNQVASDLVNVTSFHLALL